MLESLMAVDFTQSRKESAKPQRDTFSFYCAFASAEGRFASSRETFFYTIFDL
jgi:hypothetical protein